MVMGWLRVGHGVVTRWLYCGYGVFTGWLRGGHWEVVKWLCGVYGIVTGWLWGGEEVIKGGSNVYGFYRL